MQLTYEIKDEHIIAFAKAMGFQYPEDKVPPIEEHEAAINSFAKGFFDQFYNKIANEVASVDPAVVAKEAEVVQLRAAIIDQVKSVDVIKTIK